VSPDGTLAAVGGFHTQAALYELPGGTALGDLPRRSGTYIDDVYALAFNPQGTLVVGGGSDNYLRMWSVPGRTPVGRDLAMGSALNSVVFTPDGSRIVCAGDGRARVIDVASQREVQRLIADDAFVVALSADGALLAIGGLDEPTVRLWRLADGQPVGDPMPGHTGPVAGLAFHPNGRLLASTGSHPDRSLRLWSVENGLRPLGEPMRGGGGKTAFTSDGALLAANGLVYETTTWGVVAVTAGGALDVSDRASTLVTGGIDSSGRLDESGTVRVYDITSA
jgi:WD40 repeat protein